MNFTRGCITALRGSESEEAEGPGRLVGETVEHGGDGGGSRHSQEADGHVPEGGHDMGALTCPRRTAIFQESGIADPMETILHLPVPPNALESLIGRGAFFRDTGDPEGRFPTSFSGFFEGGVPIDDEDLFETGKVGVTFEGGRDTNGLSVDPPVAEEGLFIRRGKKPRDRGSRYRFGGFFGSL